MKRLICITISFVMIIYHFVFLGGLFKSYSFSGLDDFAMQYIDMLYEASLTNSISNKSKKIAIHDKNLNSPPIRVIVKSKMLPEPYGAVSYISGYRNLWVMEFNSFESADYALSEYIKTDGIEYAEYDSVIKLESIESKEFNNNDTISEFSWDSDMVGLSEISAFYSKSSSNLSNVKVAIIDGPIDISHEYLSSRIISPNVELVSLSTGIEEDDLNLLSHATHIAGIIVKNTLSNVKIQGYDIFGKNVDSTELLLSLAIDYAVRDKMQIINLSLSFDNSRTVSESLQNALDNNVELIAAAGNDGGDCANLLPASFEEAIVVSAVDSDYKIAEFSNYGDTVDIAAPGVDIYSCLNDNLYGFMSGTSMATPFVVAAVAWIKSLESNLSHTEIKEIIKSTPIEYKPELHYYGDGILQLAETIPLNRLETVSVNNLNRDMYDSEVEISFPDVEEKIYYSLDGSTPTSATGTLYDQPFRVYSTCELNWRCYSEEKNIFFSPTQTVHLQVYECVDSDDFICDENGTIITYIGDEKSIIIPDVIDDITIKTIGESAFSGTNVVDVVIPDTVDTIGKSAFYDCSSLSYVTALSVRNIEDKAFENDYNLKKISFPKVLTVGKESFAYCYKLNDLDTTLLETIGEQAFKCTYSLKNYDFSNVVLIGAFAFELSGITKAVFQNLETLSTHKSASNTFFTNNCFYGCEMLEEINIPSVKTMGKNRPYSNISNLPKLKKIIAPNLKRLNSNSLNNCPLLQEVNLNSVTQIGDKSFNYCKSLKELKLPSVKTIESNTFIGSGIEKLYLENIETIETYLTNDCIIVLPSDVDLSSLDDVQIQMDTLVYPHIAVYCIGGKASEWAMKKHQYCSSEWIQTPVLNSEIPFYINSNDKIYFDVTAINPTFQWYGSIDGTISNFEILEGETNLFLIPPVNDKYLGYFCLISDYDGTHLNTVFSDVILKKVNKADYSELEKIKSSIPEDLSLYTDETVSILNEVIFEIDMNLDVTEQYLVDKYVIELIKALDKLELKKNNISPSISIQNYVQSRIVDYKSTIIFTVTTDNMTNNLDVVWFKDDEEIGTGEKVTISNVKRTFNIQAKLIDENDSIIDSTDIELVIVKTDFLTKLIAFIKLLINRLPILEQ